MAVDWAGMASAYDVSFAQLCAGTLPFLIDRGADIASGGRALDVGTGTGSAASALAAAGFEVLAVDADPGMIEFASRRHPDVRFSVGALPALPFVDDEFDLTVANVVNHVPKPRDAAHELARVTASRGPVLITIWPSNPISAMNQLWNRTIVDAGAIPLSGHRLPAEDDFERTAHGLSWILEDAGMTDVEVDELAWDFTIEAERLWTAAEAGIANIGATYRKQTPEGRRAMRAAYEDLTDMRTLTLPSVALLGVGRAP